MRRSQIDNLTWSSHTNGNVNSSNLWPELCQNNEIRHATRKKVFINMGESNGMMSLDDFEYPELGDTSFKSKSSTPKEHCLPSSSIQILVPMKSDIEPKRSKFLKRYKRSDKICINLQEALQSIRYTNKMNKELPKLKINLYRGSLGNTVPNILDRNKSSDLRKVKICISKDKKPSKLKKIILFSRNIQAQANVEKREAFECKKIEAICRDVDAINFNALKITTDQEVDTDYVRNMCTMTLYDKDYRSMNGINIADSNVFHRPDVIEKINHLRIQGRQLTNRIVKNINTSSFIQFDTGTIENDIINQTLSLQIEEIKQEIPDSTEVDNKNFVKFSRTFREYCTNMLTMALNNSLDKFLEETSRLQKRCYEKNPNKSNRKRRYYSGLKEVRKYAELKKLKFIIIAPDIEKVKLNDGLDDQVDKLLDTCKKQNIVFCFGLRRRKLGYYTHGKGLVGCIGIANYSGIELLFKNVLTELAHARNAFKKLNGATDTTIDISKLNSEDQLLSENINSLLNLLSYNVNA